MRHVPAARDSSVPAKEAEECRPTEHGGGGGGTRHVNIPEGGLGARGRVVINVLHNEGDLHAVLLTPRGSVLHQNFQRNGGILS